MRSPIRLAAAAALVLTALPALAQTPDTAKKEPGKPLGFLTDTTKKYGLVPQLFTIAIGGFLPHVSSQGRLSSPSLPGSSVDLEHALGLAPNLQSLDVLATIRLGKKQLITLGYFGFRRSATKSLQDSIVWGDSVYHAGADLDATAALQYYGLTYRYYFFRKERWELGAGLGIDGLVMSASLGLRVASGGGFADSAKRSGSLTAPAPMLGIYGDWEFVPRFYLRAQAQLLYINNVESYGGGITDDRLAVEWYPLHNYGVGLGYHYVGVKVTKTFSNGGELEYKYYVGGPSLYLTAAF